MIILEGETFFHEIAKVKVTLLKYDENTREVKIQFHSTESTVGGIIDGYIHEYAYFKKYGRKNPFERSFLGVGYLGEFRATSSDKNTPVRTKLLRIWEDMIKRCYDPTCNNAKNYHDKNVVVDSRWHNFHNFYLWAIDKDQGGFIYNMNMSLDKDLFQFNRSNKVYSPEVCVFLPHNINTSLASLEREVNKSGDFNLPPGVVYERSGKYTARIHLAFNGKVFLRKQIHTSESLSEVYSTYVVIKEHYLKELASYYYSMNLINSRALDQLYKIKMSCAQVSDGFINRNIQLPSVTESIRIINELFKKLKEDDTLKAQRLSEQDMNEKSFIEN